MSSATHRHKKTGRLYTLIGYGRMQSKEWVQLHGDPNGGVGIARVEPVDMREVAIYQHGDGSLWVRPREEFEDGRFIKLGEPNHD